MPELGDMLREKAEFIWQTEYMGQGLAGGELLGIIIRVIEAAVEDHERRHHAGEARTEGHAG